LANNSSSFLRLFFTCLRYPDGSGHIDEDQKEKTVVGTSREPLVISATIGTDPNIPPEVRHQSLLESVERMEKRRREVSDALYQWLLIDGLEHRISDDDIADLAAPDKHSEFMRKIVVELMLCLRLRREKERDAKVKETAYVEGALSLGG
jgi:hypothetical protein